MALEAAHHSMCATPGETGGWRRRTAADAAAIHTGAWSIPSVPGKEEEREAGMEDLCEGNDRPRESPDQPSGTGLALSGPFPRASRGGGFGTEHARCKVVARSPAEPPARRQSSGAVLSEMRGRPDGRACRSSRRTASDVRWGAPSTPPGRRGIRTGQLTGAGVTFPRPRSSLMRGLENGEWLGWSQRHFVASSMR